MTKRPFFSIVIPTYNRCSDLEFALFCIFQQSFKNFEVIISDNCSSDNTRLVVNNYNDARVHYSCTNRTVGNAINIDRGIRLAKGKYVFLHSDDDFLFNPDSLMQIHEEITKYKPGYIRVNYINLSIDRKRIFDFKTNKSFQDNVYITKNESNKKIVSFILASDPYFISGIIFNNNFAQKMKIADSDPVPWIHIVFYSIEKAGGRFISKPHIVASWSRRKINKNAEHHVFTLINGKLRSENYLEAIRSKLSNEEYEQFLHTELILHYVNLFPAIKLNVGNRKMLQMSRRITVLDPTIHYSITYWTHLIGALILPKTVLLVLRDAYLDMYSRVSKVKESKEITNILKMSETKFLNTKHSRAARKDPIFKL